MSKTTKETLLTIVIKSRIDFLLKELEDISCEYYEHNKKCSNSKSVFQQSEAFLFPPDLEKRLVSLQVQLSILKMLGQ